MNEKKKQIPLSHNPDIIDLKKQKITKEIEQLGKDIIKRDLQIEQLKNTLIDSTEVADFLKARRAIELAVLRRCFFTQMPIEITGLTIPSARDKATEYYNNVLNAYEQTEVLWTNKYPVTGSLETFKVISGILSKFEASGSQQSQTQDSGSVKTP